MPGPSQRRTARSRTKGNPALRRRMSQRCERLESRRLLTFVWINRGDSSDQFDAAFGSNAELARGVVDSALNEWNRVVTGFGGASFQTDMTIMMNPANPAISAAASATVTDGNGVPISGTVTINMALDGSGNTQWYLDPTPDDHSEFMGTLIHPFARNPTPGGPADNMRDLRTLLVHELGHTMGVSSGSQLMYSNPSITMTDTGVTDNSVGSGNNNYWLFQGPSVNAVMTDFDILGPVTPSAGHTAMPLAGNPALNFGGQLYYTNVDTMQPTSLSIRRILLTDKVALMMQDMGYDVTMPETFGTFHSVLDATSGLLTIQGGNDNTQINNVNQGVSSDTITLLRSGGLVFVGVDLGVDVPGAGNGLTPQDQQDMYISHFSVSDISSITIEGFGGNDSVTLIGDFDFLDSLVVVGGDGNDTVDGAALAGVQSLLAFGSAGNDTLLGGPGDDALSGLGGDDVIRGNGGDDEIEGGTGNDNIRGGSGNDDIEGGNDNDNIQGNSGNDTISGGLGNDLIVGGSPVAFLLQNLPDGSDTINGDGGNDIILGDNALGIVQTPLGGAADSIHGGAGNDLVFGGIGNDDLFGDADNDTLAGYSGNDDLDGGAGNDSLRGDAGDDQLVGGLGADNLDGGNDNDNLVGGTLLENVSDASGDTLRGGQGNDTLLGDNFGFGPAVGGNDSLQGDEGADNLYGQYGDDLLVGGQGVDFLEGGAGDDQLVGGTVLGPADPSGDELNGGAGNDILLGDSFGFGPGVGGADTLRGGDGDDELYGQYGNDQLDGGNDDDGLHGGPDNDQLDGQAGEDDLSGDDGDDQLIGGLDSDTLQGGSGDDQLVGGTVLGPLDPSGDDLDGGSGNDTLLGDNFGFGPGVGGPDVLRGGSGRDNLYGQYDDDAMQGDSGNDFMSGGPGNDDMDGGEGADSMEGDDGDDDLDGGTGDDTAHGGADNDLIRGGVGNDQLFGDDGHDILLGGIGRDVMQGGLGRDILIGGLGTDRIAGGADDDILIAGITRHDMNDAALFAIRDEWTSRRAYEERVANLRAQPNPTFADRLNANFFLRKGIEVSDDNQANGLSGEADRDWFFAALADALDNVPGEELN